MKSFGWLFFSLKKKDIPRYNMINDCSSLPMVELWWKFLHKIKLLLTFICVKFDETFIWNPSGLIFLDTIVLWRKKTGQGADFFSNL